MTINHQPSTINYRKIVILMTVASAVIFFLCSSIRHALFQSNAYDLGWYDQFAYFISQGQPPVVSFANYHLLGDHVALIFYPIALLYRIYPDVHWLFAIQAVSLALGCWLVWRLSLQAKLPESQATMLSAAYLLYPLVFNINLYDFHPEVIAIPGIFAAVLAARRSQIGWFCFYILLILSCKVVLSLTVAAMGFWLLFLERKRLYGAVALAAGMAWFLIATQAIIPAYSGIEAAGVFRYSYLGNSVLEIIQNMFLKPHLILGRIFSLKTLVYLLLIFLPVIWGISLPCLTPLIAALPTFAVNILSDSESQRNLVQQYSVTILPFLFLAIIGTFANKTNWINSQKFILGWCLVFFIVLGKYGYFGSIYLEFIDNWQATRDGIARIDYQASMLTSSPIAPHLAHRTHLKLAIAGAEGIDLKQFDYILLNQRHPGWASSPAIVNHLIKRLEKMPEFQLNYQQDQVFLFKKKR